MLLLLDIVLLPMLFFIGLVTSYEDIKYNKIRNKWITLGLYWGLGALFLFLVWYFLAPSLTAFYHSKILKLPADAPLTVYTFNLPFLLKSFLNFIVAAVVSFIMWKANSWAAGDAKLFIVYSLLIPLFHYQKSYLPVFPSFVLLVNIFLVFWVYFLFSAIGHFFFSFYRRLADNPAGFFEALRREKIFDWAHFLPKAADKIKSFLNGLMIPVFLILAFNFIQHLAQSRWSIDLGGAQQIIFAALILFNKAVAGAIKKARAAKWIISATVLICVLGLLNDFSATLQILYRTVNASVIFVVLLALFQWLSDFYTKKNQLQTVKTADLKPGMAIDPACLESMGLADMKGDSIGGLSSEGAQKIKAVLLGKNIDSLNVFKSSPFALWMFAGAITTLLLEKSLANILLEWVSRL
ncbi:MAG: prepilin peptidase [Candidatus Portnoybacteria bacterium]|nr:prepilin peptidase [Candidatus Portnoybacteria bacterium]MDD4982870.1 prepilin peptidase [Candidatus Portnoybacteria bacterium]